MLVYQRVLWEYGEICFRIRRQAHEHSLGDDMPTTLFEVMWVSIKTLTLFCSRPNKKVASSYGVRLIPISLFLVFLMLISPSVSWSKPMFDSNLSHVYCYNDICSYR